MLSQSFADTGRIMENSVFIFHTFPAEGRQRMDLFLPHDANKCPFNIVGLKSVFLICWFMISLFKVISCVLLQSSVCEHEGCKAT